MFYYGSIPFFQSTLGPRSLSFARDRSSLLISISKKTSFGHRYKDKQKISGIFIWRKKVRVLSLQSVAYNVVVFMELEKGIQEVISQWSPELSSAAKGSEQEGPFQRYIGVQD